jgi:hypothetical protein
VLLAVPNNAEAQRTQENTWECLGSLLSRRLLQLVRNLIAPAAGRARQIRGGTDGGRGGRFGSSSAVVALDNDPVAIKHALWQTTDRTFKAAVVRFQRMKTDVQTTVEEENLGID